MEMEWNVLKSVVSVPCHCGVEINWQRLEVCSSCNLSLLLLSCLCGNAVSDNKSVGDVLSDVFHVFFSLIFMRHGNNGQQFG